MTKAGKPHQSRKAKHDNDHAINFSPIVSNLLSVGACAQKPRDQHLTTSKRSAGCSTGVSGTPKINRPEGKTLAMCHINERLSLSYADFALADFKSKSWTVGVRSVKSIENSPVTPVRGQPCCRKYEAHYQAFQATQTCLSAVARYASEAT